MHNFLLIWGMIHIKTYTKTNTNTYTYTRIGVIDTQFEIFLKCTNLPRSNRKKILKAVENKELSAFGIYIVDDNSRIAEVAVKIDWDEHQKMIGIYGTHFDTDLPGWENGAAPEAYVSAQRLVIAAKKMKKPVNSWIMVSPSVYNNPLRHKALCKELGYLYEGSPPPWRSDPVTKEYNINFLSEATVICRSIT